MPFRGYVEESGKNGQIMGESIRGGPADIRWADVIFVMERKHEHRLRAGYARLLEHKQLHVLDIPDDYRFMDPELVDMLELAVTPYLCI